MKTGLTYFIFLIAVTFTACKEEPPGINYQKSNNTLDTTYIITNIPAPQAKAALLEDISGVRCVNCPEATTIANQLVRDNPGRLYVVVNQPNIDGLKAFTLPITKDGYKSIYDLRTDAGAAICNLVGVPNSLPSGYMNRKIFPGKPDAILGREEWAGALNTELALTTPVNVELTSEIDKTTNTITVEITVTYTEAVTGKNYVSIMLVEDSIVDSQESKDENGNVVYLANYTQRHVLRDMLTASTGDLLNVTDNISLVAGRVFKKRYTKKIGVGNGIIINPNQLQIIAFVHEDPTSKYILQSNAIHLE